MSSFNSIAPYLFAKTKDLQEAFGVTQFPSETNWFQVMGGLIVQGGFLDTYVTGTVVPLNTAFPLQVLGIWVTPINSAAIVYPGSVFGVTTSQFQISHASPAPQDFYWFAIGV